MGRIERVSPENLIILTCKNYFLEIIFEWHLIEPKVNWNFCKNKFKKFLPNASGRLKSGSISVMNVTNYI